ncbi:hypothetical protein SeMB42_g05869 [Synchytrium endobioticum]|uniref:Centrosomin N-terminal motif 1 domain-containing protein n=1 Tax=Synchytrium endobioticum TaxID=286115 RepID=A0A507CNV2_9FUNG|nr:hypothetical protein SeMB42_g05869 [Synchytrium endobioticum]
MQNEEYLLTSYPPIEMTTIARSAGSSRQSACSSTSPPPKRPNRRWAHVKARVNTKGPSPKKYASIIPNPPEAEANAPETKANGPWPIAALTEPTGFDEAAFQLRMSRLELPELLPEGDEDSVEYLPPTNDYGAEREYIAKLDMENFDLKFRLYFLKEAMDKISPDDRILAIENAHLNTEITSLKAELDHYRKQMKLFDEQKSQFHQRSVSKDKEVYTVRAELQATQQALKETDDRREDVERYSRDVRAHNQHLQYQIRVLKESRDNNPGSREEENKLKSELELYRSCMTDVTGLVDQLRIDIVAERAEKQQSRADLDTALTELDQQKSALLDMSSRMTEQDSQLSNLQNESLTIKDEADSLRKEAACLKEAAVKKDDALRRATDMLNDINRQRDADYHALEAMRKEAKGNQGELGIQNRQLKQELASEKQNNNSLTAQVELLRAKNSNGVSSACLEVESLKIQAARLNERTIAHRQAVNELYERWGIEQAELKEDIALLKEERAHDIQDNEVLRSQVEDLQRLYDESEFRGQELEARQRELPAAHNEIRELKWKHGGSASVFSMDDRRKFSKLNENVRQDFCAKSKLADETAEKLRIAQSQLATTEYECNKYKRALRYREAAIRQATKILESNLQELAR